MLCVNLISCKRQAGWFKETMQTLNLGKSKISISIHTQYLRVSSCIMHKGKVLKYALKETSLKSVNFAESI